MISVGKSFIHAVAPRFGASRLAEDQRRIVNAVAPLFAPVLSAYEINTKIRIAHFTAQICHESAGFRTTEEFASGEAYEGREDLGNINPGDGVRYKGRGLIQLTGRANYREYGRRIGKPLEFEPELAAEPLLSLFTACSYWRSHGLNEAADDDDIKTITRRINGGLNGFEDRKRYLRRAKEALGEPDIPELGPVEQYRMPVLRRGDDGPAVGGVQRILNKVGADILVDRAFGPATEAAVKTFQRSHDIEADGIVGPETWGRLERALSKQFRE